MLVEREPSPGMSPHVEAAGRRSSAPSPQMEGKRPGLQHSLLGRAHPAPMAFGPHTYSHGNKSSQWAKFSIRKLFPIQHLTLASFEQPWCWAGWEEQPSQASRD